ncbi:MAG: L-threonylcarbamoyladenylate synthase [Gaiellaceae bacterium]|jgi:L-threonylcarbamoyladenylate synthase|nr:L-threonylcarbamoyladenylate synthase [Gaiellaceae bacterium]
MTEVDAVAAAVRAGQPVVLPFDTVYGLAADASSAESTRRLYEVKGRAEAQPTALVARDLDHLLELIPELRASVSSFACLLPGPVTLVVSNPARRFPWLAGANPDAIGIRVPRLDGATAAVLELLGAVAATSANHPGGQDPVRLDDVPRDIRDAAGAEIDAGELPGSPSTVLDLTGAEPRVLREGALPAAEVLRRLGAAVRSG